MPEAPKQQYITNLLKSMELTRPRSQTKFMYSKANHLLESYLTDTASEDPRP